MPTEPTTGERAAHAAGVLTTATRIAYALRHHQLAVSEYDMDRSDAIEECQRVVMQMYDLTDHDLQFARQTASVLHA